MSLAGYAPCRQLSFWHECLICVMWATEGPNFLKIETKNCSSPFSQGALLKQILNIPINGCSQKWVTNISVILSPIRWHHCLKKALCGWTACRSSHTLTTFFLQTDNTKSIYFLTREAGLEGTAYLFEAYLPLEIYVCIVPFSNSGGLSNVLS